MARGTNCFFLLYLTLMTAEQKQGLVRAGNSSSGRGCCEGRAFFVTCFGKNPQLPITTSLGLGLEL